MLRTRVTWVSYLTLAFYGYFLNAFGPITPYLKSELNLSYTLSSLHFSAFAVGMLCAGLIVGWFVLTAFGWQAAMVIGVVAVVVTRFAFGKLPLPRDQASAGNTGARRSSSILYWVNRVSLWQR